VDLESSTANSRSDLHNGTSSSWKKWGIGIAVVVSSVLVLGGTINYYSSSSSKSSSMDLLSHSHHMEKHSHHSNAKKEVASGSKSEKEKDEPLFDELREFYYI
jgi:hypothetical protein